MVAEDPGKKYQLDVTDAYKLLLTASDKLSLGASGLDAALRYCSLPDIGSGGIRTRIITEISGESGTGKTQFCMQLMLHTLLPPKVGGLGGAAYYISTHKSLSETRFDEIKSAYLSKYSDCLSPEQVEKNIITAHLTDKDKDELKIYLNDLQKKLENKEPFKLLIIDTITAVCYSFVTEGNKVDRLERAAFLLNLVNTIKKLAHQYNLAVVVVNNTVGDIEKTGAVPGATSIPALGLLWSNSVNQRIFLIKRGHGKDGKAPKRLMEVVFSPSVPHSTVEFTIIKDGITTDL